MRSVEDVLSVVRDSTIIGVVRYEDAAWGAMVARTFADAGLKCVEVTMTTPGAIDLISELAYNYRDSGVVIAAGSVREIDEVDRVVDAGAEIVVSPHTSERVIEKTLERGRVSVAGAATASEVIRAHELGASIVKVYPARLLGGPEWFRTVGQPIRGIEMLAGGPVDTDEIHDYLGAGAVALNMGGSFAPVDLIEANDWEAIGGRVREAIEEVERFRSNEAE